MRRCSIALLIANCLAFGSETCGAEGDAGPMISIEIVIAEFSHPMKGDEVAKYEVIENVTERLKQLERSGQLGAVVRMQLTTLDRFPTKVTIGERAAVATGRARPQGGSPGDRGGSGQFQAAYSFQNVGAVVNVTPTVESDGSIVLTLEAERTRLVPGSPSAGASAPNDESMSRTVTSSAMTTIRVASGQTVLVSGAKTVDQDRSGELLILASARVIPRKD